MGVVGKVAASDTDGVDFTDQIGRAQRGGRGSISVVAVSCKKACDYHPFTPVCKFLGDLHQRHVIELRLIYSNHLDVVGDIQHLLGILHCVAGDLVEIVGDYIVLGVSGVNGRLEYLDLEICEFSSPDPADEFLGLAREH